MTGELIDDVVYVRDQTEGNRLYSKGNYGYPMRGGGIELDLIEATYLVESKRLQVFLGKEEMTFEDLFNYSASNYSDFDIKYMVYRELRGRGMVVKVESGTFDMSVFPRGKTMSNSRPIYLVRAVSERAAFDISLFSGELDQTENKGKTLLYGVVDEEGDVLYYKMSHCDPKGDVFPEKTQRITGHLIRDRVFVFDPNDSMIIYENGYFGKVIENVLQMSILEACYLMGRKQLSVTMSGKKLTLEELMEFGRDSQEEFDLRFKAYSDARSRGLIVKTGLKYGTHFRAYEGSPDDVHARYLMHAVDTSNRAMWPEISRAVRLSTGVKKEFLFCRIGESVEYLEFEWFRP